MSPRWSSGSAAGTPGRCCAAAIRGEIVARLKAEREAAYAEAPIKVMSDAGPARRDRQPHPAGARRMAVIPVELAGRSYEVRVGSGLLADVRGPVRRRCCASARVPIVTDANVAAALAGDGRGLADRGRVRAALAGARARRRRQELGRARARGRLAAGRGSRARRPCPGARRRGDRRPDRVRRGDPQARLRLRPAADHAARAGRFERRRQDRDQQRAPARTSSARSTSRAWCWPTSTRSPPCPRARCARATPR